MFYSATPLDRLDQLRKDDNAVEALWLAEGTRVVPLRNHQILATNREDTSPRAVSIPVPASLPPSVTKTLLGKQGDIAWFSLDYSLVNESEFVDQPADSEFVDLRLAGPNLPEDEAAILAYARALSFWQQNSGFCSKCGHQNTLINAGHVKKCQNSDCATESFPRTDPAVIMLVEDNSGDIPKCLLGRSAAWPDGVYSTLAGFVEPGESLEAAVAREVKEESNIDVTDVRYIASQPWPFPRSIMLGFRATATSQDVIIEPTELADAQWFTRDEIRTFGVWGEESDRLKLPRPDSIARFLVDSWLNETDPAK